MSKWWKTLRVIGSVLTALLILATAVGALYVMADDIEEVELVVEKNSDLILEHSFDMVRIFDSIDRKLDIITDYLIENEDEIKLSLNQGNKD